MNRGYFLTFVFVCVSFSSVQSQTCPDFKVPCVEVECREVNGTCGGTNNICLCPLETTFPYCLPTGGVCQYLPEKVDDICGVHAHCLNVSHEGKITQVECREIGPLIWRCACRQGESVGASDGKCYRHVGYNETCDVSEQCQEFSGTCFKGVGGDGRCGCRDTEIFHDKCYPKVEVIGGACNISEQCTMGWNPVDNVTVCHEERCQCINGTAVGLPIEDPTLCYSVRRFEYDSCVEDDQCKAGLGPFSNCNILTRVCRCSDGTEFVDVDEPERCVDPRPLNTTCCSSGECMASVPDSYCPNHLNPECQNSSTCRLNPQCQNITCRCVENTLPWDQRCYKMKVVGDFCASDLECRVPIDGEVECNPRQSMCICKEGYSPDNQGRRCAKNGGNVLSLSFVMLLLSCFINFKSL